jgi:hypothetical protein
MPVELRTEPPDSIEIGALAAKANGILGLARKSLHFELPSRARLDPHVSRAAYVDILMLLSGKTGPVLSKAK